MGIFSQLLLRWVIEEHNKYLYIYICLYRWILGFTRPYNSMDIKWVVGEDCLRHLPWCWPATKNSPRRRDHIRRITATKEGLLTRNTVFEWDQIFYKNLSSNPNSGHVNDDRKSTSWLHAPYCKKIILISKRVEGYRWLDLKLDSAMVDYNWPLDTPFSQTDSTWMLIYDYI